jgi:transcription antitermination factor NusA-like protein
LKTPICNFCLKSGMLCSNCQDKLRTGQIKELDITAARILQRLEEKYPILQDVTFKKAEEGDDVLALVVGRGDIPKLLSFGGKILRTIGEETGKKIRVLEYGGDDRKFLEDLFAPLTIVTINTLWLPDGNRETKVILAGRPRSLPVDVKVLKELARKIRGITLRVEFERP